MELEIIQQKIFTIRGFKVLLDFDLANLYEVETRVLKQNVRRNIFRFPSDFMFQLTKSEWHEVITNCDNLPETVKFSPQPPYSFTEQGVAMLSSVLKSKKAVETNIAIMRTFVEIRKMVSFQSEISQQILLFKQELEERIGEHDIQLLEIYNLMENIIDKNETQQKLIERKPIGYKK
jgi:ORF6N domain